MSEHTEDQPLRYRIKALLVMLNLKKRAEVKEAIQQEHGLSNATYQRYTNLRMDDSNDIPAKVLAHFARLLGTTTEELFNSEPEIAAKP